ncbi:tyrosine-type recombinase/integrase [Thiosulfativibrio zosterae]|uniref:Integrase n=1 Tax=Thiosulfativibrio zosterae TaxID=2675053 RepID=A0A6F8PN58_9GAMM|nr:site-specific integrase [Thiosulfativibrio zosterae]BBP43535.1 hypothetical protein THMIRHAT_12810 [Thiosulfativibrio zosterae]
MSISKYQTKNSTRYRVNKMIDGERYSKSFPTLQEANDWLSLINHANTQTTLGKIAKAELTQIDELKIRAKTPTYFQVVQDYQSANLGLKCDHAQKQLDYFLDFWGNTPINVITRIMVENALDDIAERKSLAGPTINRYQAAISSLFKWAAQQRKYRELQLVNPTIGIVRRKESKGREVFLSKQQQADLLIASQNAGWIGLPVLLTLLLTTGARRNEIAKLKWENVDLKKGFVLLTNTKNGDDHKILISSETVKMLKAFKMQSPLSNWVFPIPNNPKKPMVNFDYYWKRAKEASDMPSNLRIHDLRHTTASTMLEDGFSLEDIKQTLNHKSVQMTNRYAHHAKIVSTVLKRDVNYLAG